MIAPRGKVITVLPPLGGRSPRVADARVRAYLRTEQGHANDDADDLPGHFGGRARYRAFRGGGPRDRRRAARRRYRRPLVSLWDGGVLRYPGGGAERMFLRRKGLRG